MKRLIWLLLIGSAFAQAGQVNNDIIPANTGLNIGHSNQRWNLFAQNLDVSGTCNINGVPCLSGTVAFSGIASGTNTTAAMICGTGCSFGVSGSGTNTATALTGTPNITVGAITASTASFTGQITSTLAIGTAPFSITSTTNVPNLNASLLNGNTFSNPGAIGGGTAASGAFTTVSATGQISSTVSTGTAPLVIASTTNIPNLNASLLLGNTWAAPGPIGGTTPGAVTATSVTTTGPTGSDTLSETFGSTEVFTSNGCEAASAPTTLNTGGTTTDTGQTCLPANAIIDVVVYRITTTITTAANFTIGDATTAARFCSTQSTLTAGTTGVCFVQADQTGAAGPRQTSAVKVRVTTNANPGAGAIRLIVYYHGWTAPTS